MSRFLLSLSLVAGLSFIGLGGATPAHAQDDGEWARNVRFTFSAGVNSSEAIDALTFREGDDGHSGWGWQAAAAYPLQNPFFAEAGLMGWTLARTDLQDTKSFGLTGSVGVDLGDGGTQIGAGFIPRGTRIFARHFFDRYRPGKGTMAQVGVIFPTPSGTRSFLDLSVGYGF